MESNAPDLDPQFLYKCAALLLKCKNYSFARTLYRMLLEKDNKNVEALKGYGICFFAEGNMAAAKLCFQGYKKITGLEIDESALSKEFHPSTDPQLPSPQA